MSHHHSVDTPAGADLDTMQQMAASFAESYARMGHNGPGILRIFQNPFYDGPYRLYRALGHALASAVIDQCVAAHGGGRIATPVRGHPS